MTPHVVFAHGFTQTSRSWDVVRALLAQTCDDVSTTAVDLPGHGAAATVHADLWQAADHLVAAGGRGCYVGYSMGGRVTLHAALAHPDVVSAMVLIGATAGIDDAEGRQERRRADDLLALQLERDGVAAFVDQWLKNPLFAGLTDDTAGRDDRLNNDAAGLASSLRLAGTGSQEPLWDRLHELECPTLILVGERDAKFRTLGDRLCDGITGARLAVVSEAGHSVHLEQPHQTAALVAEFLTTHCG